MKLKVPESGTLRACLDLLAYEHIWHRRWNTGAIRNGSGRPVKFGQKGDADILAAPQQHNGILKEAHTSFNKSLCFRNCCPDPLFLWIECKSDSGQQTQAQKEFQKEVEAAGHHYLIVRNVEELKAWLRSHGVIR